MSKFIVHPLTMFYSTHGEISALQTYNAFVKEGLRDNFYVTGFYDNGESKSHIKSMTPVNCDKYYAVKISGASIQHNTIYVFENQRFLLESGETISVKDLKPDMLVVSLNGKMLIELVELCDIPALFYDVETEDFMGNIYMTNIILMQIENEVSENNQGFFPEF